MRESEFHQDLVAGFTSIGWWMHKLPDLARGVTKPFDLIGCAHGKGVAIEAKWARASRKMDSQVRDSDLLVQMTDFRPHQKSELRKFYLAGGFSFAALGIEVIDCMLARGERKAWLVPMEWLLDQPEWRVHEMDPRCRLVWQPGVGWLPQDDLRRYAQGAAIFPRYPP